MLARRHFILPLGLRLLLVSDQVHELVCYSRVLEILWWQGWVICSLHNLLLVLLPNDKFIQFGVLSNSLDSRLLWSSCCSRSSVYTLFRLRLFIWGVLIFFRSLISQRWIVLLRLFDTGTCAPPNRRSRVLCDITFNGPLREQDLGLQQWECSLVLPRWYNLSRIAIQIRLESILLFLLPLVLFKLSLSPLFKFNHLLRVCPLEVIDPNFLGIWTYHLSLFYLKLFLTQPLHFFGHTLKLPILRFLLSFFLVSLIAILGEKGRFGLLLGNCFAPGVYWRLEAGLIFSSTVVSRIRRRLRGNWPIHTWWKLRLFWLECRFGFCQETLVHWVGGIEWLLSRDLLACCFILLSKGIPKGILHRFDRHFWLNLRLGSARQKLGKSCLSVRANGLCVRYVIWCG